MSERLSEAERLGYGYEHHGETVFTESALLNILTAHTAALRAELDAEKAKVARVEALAAKYERHINDSIGTDGEVPRVSLAAPYVVSDLRAALGERDGEAG